MSGEPARSISAMATDAVAAALVFAACFYGAVVNDGRVMTMFEVAGVFAMGVFGRAVWGLVPALRRHHRERKGGRPLKLL